MEDNEMKECLMKIKEHCINTTCDECKIHKWCSNYVLRDPGAWPNFEPEWQVIEYDINENGWYNVGEGESIPHFDYAQGLRRLMTIHNVNASDVSFGGWFYADNCSWHKSPVLKAEVPCKIRFHIRK